MDAGVLHAIASYVANYVPTVDKGTYDYALSNTCLITFLVHAALAALVYFDATNRGLYGPMWAFVTFGIPYAGVFIYVFYIVAFGHTRFHIVKDPAAEEIKRKWEDTESSLERERKERKEWKGDTSPYKRL